MTDQKGSSTETPSLEIEDLVKKDPLVVYRKMELLRVACATAKKTYDDEAQKAIRWDTALGAVSSVMLWLVTGVSLLSTLGVSAEHVLYVIFGVSFTGNTFRALRGWLSLQSVYQSLKQSRNMFSDLSHTIADRVPSYAEMNFDQLAKEFSSLSTRFKEIRQAARDLTNTEQNAILSRKIDDASATILQANKPQSQPLQIDSMIVLPSTPKTQNKKRGSGEIKDDTVEAKKPDLVV